MDRKSERTLDVEDFNPDDFDNPIKLLEAISVKQSESSASQADLDNYISIREKSDIPGAYTLSEISRMHEIPIHMLRSAIESGTLKMSAYMPLLAVKDVEAFINERGENAVFTSFIYEVQNMRTNYSYKPVLLLALLQKSNELGEANIDDIIDYFLGFYEARKAGGLVVEKSDSSFVKNPDNRTSAKVTIVRYPVAVFVDKQFLKYNKGTGIISISPLIWVNLTRESRQSVTVGCLQALQKYYNKL